MTQLPNMINPDPLSLFYLIMHPQSAHDSPRQIARDLYHHVGPSLSVADPRSRYVRCARWRDLGRRP